MAFATLILSELLRPFTARSERLGLFSLGPFSSPGMNSACLSSFLLILAVIYVPFLDPVFSTMALGWRDWLVMTPLYISSPVAAEVTKFALRRRAASRRPLA
ncbi:MAG: cation-translocating P-type ATPase C-terminal domain-containing protein [Anaerolineales bacterium]